MSLAFAPDGTTLASASSDRTIKLWDLATHKEKRTLRGHADPLSSVAFSPDGARLVSGAGAIRFNPGHQGEVKLWDVASGTELAILQGNTRGVSSVAVTPDGKSVASSSRDNAIRIWNIGDVPQPQLPPEPQAEPNQ
jgi:WD40 repeat protein